jgi:hypothetical protein
MPDRKLVPPKGVLNAALIKQPNRQGYERLDISTLSL